MPSFINSLRHAWRGLKTVVRTEKSFRIHLLLAALVLILAWYRDLGKLSWVALFLIIAFILSLEIFNSAIERLVDILAPKTHSYAKDIKDLLAAMVLLASIFAVIIGLFIFL